MLNFCNNLWEVEQAVREGGVKVALVRCVGLLHLAQLDEHDFQILYRADERTFRQPDNAAGGLPWWRHGLWCRTATTLAGVGRYELE